MIIFDGREDRVQVRCLAGCSSEDIINVLRDRGLWTIKPTDDPQQREKEREEQKKKEHRMRLLARGIFDEAKPIRGSLAETYLESRNIHDVARMIDDIRYHATCPRYSGPRYIVQPALVIAMRSVATNSVVAIQRIFLTRSGRKDGKGMMLGPASGAAMKLQHLQNHALHICEGLETGLSILAMDQGPVWAVGSTSNMQNFPILDSVNKLAIWADNDEAGLKAAAMCEQRWTSARKTVEVHTPKKGARDFNDVWSYRCARL
jgi:hypothetical protein